MRNPFKEPTMQREYAAAAHQFDARHRNLFMADGSRRRSPDLGSSFATFFWAGYDGLKDGIYRFNTATEKNIVAYAYYRAGKDARQRDPAWVIDNSAPETGAPKRTTP